MRTTTTAAATLSAAGPAGRDRPPPHRSPVVVSGASPLPPLAGAPDCNASPRSHGCVLVVEDDPKFAAVLERHLHAVGVSSRLAESGDTALTAVRAFEVAGLVLDIMIPHPDGIEVCRQLRRDRWNGLIVAMSARTGPIHEAAIRDAGADVFLAKPFPLDDLTAALAPVLPTEEVDP